MPYAIPKEFSRMTPRERWKWAYSTLSIPQTAFYFKRGLASCFYVSGFDVVRFGVDDYGFLFDTLGEKYLIVKRRKCDNYAYLISRFGVTRVREWDND